MSFIVKGRAAPKDCAACLWMRHCLLVQAEAYLCVGRRHPDCPIVELETPHGRLIDADALIESLLVDPVACPGCPEPEDLESLILMLESTATLVEEER